MINHSVLLFFVFQLFLFPCFLFAKIEIVYHIATMNHWEEVVNEQIQILDDSGLAAACDCLTVTVVGSEIKRVHELFQASNFYDKIEIVHFGTDVLLCEFPGIEMVKKIAAEKPDAKILYMHSKGVTHKKGTSSYHNVLSWRRYLEHFVIGNWQQCVEALESHTCCGVEWLNIYPSPRPAIEFPGFFAGNFWWARADYLRTCQELPSDPWDSKWCYLHRYDCETFITTGENPVAKSFYQSGVNLYSFNYVPEYYKNESDLKKSGKIEVVYLVFADIDRMALFQKHLELFGKSGFMKAWDRLTVIVLGPEIETVRNFLESTRGFEKTRVIHISSESFLGEFPAIEMIKQISRTDPHAKICYLHNLEEEKYQQLFCKTYTSLSEAIRSTLHQVRKRMKAYARDLFLGNQKIENSCWMIENWKRCLESLSSVDVCGIGWKKGLPRMVEESDVTCEGHFKHNCWWARAQYLNTCEDVQYHSPFNLYSYRWGSRWLRHHLVDCQAFIGTGKQPSIKDCLIPEE